MLKGKKIPHSSQSRTEKLIHRGSINLGCHKILNLHLKHLFTFCLGNKSIWCKKKKKSKGTEESMWKSQPPFLSVPSTRPPSREPTAITSISLNSFKVKVSNGLLCFIRTEVLVGASRGSGMFYLICSPNAFHSSIS